MNFEELGSAIFNTLKTGERQLDTLSRQEMLILELSKPDWLAQLGVKGVAMNFHLEEIPAAPEVAIASPAISLKVIHGPKGFEVVDTNNRPFMNAEVLRLCHDGASVIVHNVPFDISLKDFNS